MCSSLVPDEAEPGRPTNAPPFDPQEKTLIAAWSEHIATRGYRTAISTHYQNLDEVLLVYERFGEPPRWIIHKTPDGLVAARDWPGIAMIVPAIPEALETISGLLAQTPPDRRAARVVALRSHR